MLERYFAAHPLTDVRYMPQFPPAADRAAWEGIDPADRADLLALADKWCSQPYPLLTAGMYASFVRTGSRRDCENPYFARRVKLCSAALHVCLTGTDELLPDVEDGLWLLCEETAWVISAHAGLNAAHPFPDDRATIVDLFAAQTGMILSFVVQLLGDRLHPDLAARVRREVERRILRPFMDNDGEWWMGFTRKDLNNWTPWIISNILMTANVWHWGGTALVERACMMLDRWLDCVPADGGCDEGAGYWNMAGGAFLDCLMALESMCAVNLWQDEKVRRMMAYPELVYLGNGWFANFADCDARPYISGERLQYAGEKTGNAALIRMGAEMRGLPSKELSDTPHLSRVLMRIFSKPAQVEAGKPIAATEPGFSKDVWLPDLQVRLIAGVQQDPAHPAVISAMKGGHNGESHNHNDVGSFLLMSQGRMRVVDAGNMVYTAKTFSASRYELWNCRSTYHNVPIIGGYEQQPGAEYAARDVQYMVDGMSLDMAGAYPAEAGVSSLKRWMNNTDDQFRVMDEISLEREMAVSWVFMLRDEPVVQQGNVMMDGMSLRWDLGHGSSPLTAEVEPIEITDSRMAKSYPGTLWRLVLTAPAATFHRQYFLFET